MRIGSTLHMARHDVHDVTCEQARYLGDHRTQAGNLHDGLGNSTLKKMHAIFIMQVNVPHELGLAGLVRELIAELARH